MTTCLEKRMVRQALLGDDLSALKGDCPVGLNYAQVLVVDAGERIEGMLVLWDGGHEQIRVDHLAVLPDAPENTGAKLIEGLLSYCRRQKITDVLYCTSSEELIAISRTRGALVSESMRQISVRVPEE